MTIAYTVIVSQLRNIPLTVLQDDEKSSIIIDNLIEEYSLNDEQLSDDEMQYLMDSVAHYVDVVIA